MQPNIYINLDDPNPLDFPYLTTINNSYSNAVPIHVNQTQKFKATNHAAHSPLI